MTRLLLFLLLATGVAACHKSETTPEKGTVAYFQTYLKADMSFAAIKERFGEPGSDIGSGIHIYVYPLNDGTQVWIGYTDKILYARHMDQNRQVIAVLI